MKTSSSSTNKVEPENFLDESFGNFLDCIKNEVYSLQVFIDTFHNNVSDLYETYDVIEKANIRSVLKLMILESGNLIRCKIILFTVNIENLLLIKYDHLIRGITESDIDKYYISKDAYLYLDSYQDTIDWNALSAQLSFYPTSSDIQFSKYLESELLKHESIKFTKFPKAISKEELLTILNSEFIKLAVTMLHFKRLTEKASTIALNYELCRNIISMLVKTYFVIRTIEY